MKKLLLISAAFLAVALQAGAQNNGYSIDDECYTYFQTAEKYVDDFESDTFDTAMQNLLETSLRKKDSKAQTIYYVEILKRLSREGQRKRNQDIGSWDSIEWNARIDEAAQTAQRISKATGYMQYYYYASELCQTYYFNTRQDIQASENITAMMEEAKESGDEYALWRSLIYLGKLYLRVSDLLSTKKYTGEAVRIFETSTDPTIRRQSMVIQYCELADTYPVASDSARMYYNRAEAGCYTIIDTMRVAYYKAQLAAWDNNIPEYQSKRDFCLSQPNFTSLIRGGKDCFACIDNILAGNPASRIRKNINALYIRQQMNFVAELAAKNGQWETATHTLRILESRLFSDIHVISGQRLEQLTARYEKHQLETELAAAERQTKISRIHTAALVAALLLFALLHLIIVSRKHKK